MKTQLMIIGATLALLPAFAEAQSQTRGASARAEAGVEARGSAGGEEGSVAGSAALSANAAAGLPEAPVRRAIAEERSKGGTRSEIDRAAMTAHSRLRISRETLAGEDGQRRVSDSEITAGAEAMAAGATRMDLARVENAAPAERNLTASLNALTRLNARGMGGAEGAAQIAGRLQSGASDRSISALGGGAASTSRGALEAGAGAGAMIGGAGGMLNAGASVVGSLGGGIFR